MKTKRKSFFQSPARQLPGKRRSRSGTAIIETVFALQVLLILSFGMVEFGQFMYIRHAFVSAARDGARAASLPTTNSLTPVTNALTTTLSLAGITYNTSWLTLTQSSDGSTYTTCSNPGSVSAGNYICVTVSTTYSQLPLALRPLSAITGNNFGIGAAKMVTGSATVIAQ